MKRILTIIALIAFSLGVQAQVTDLSTLLTYKDGRAHFSEVVQVSNATSDNLYKNALTWINGTFNNPQNVIQTNNRELGLLVIKAAVGEPSMAMTHFTFEIQIKDGRYKYDISNIVIKYGKYLAGTPDKSYEEYIETSGYGWKKGVNSDFGDLVKSLKSKMQDVEEDW
jgi:hypothetical protein